MSAYRAGRADVISRVDQAGDRRMVRTHRARCGHHLCFDFEKRQRWTPHVGLAQAAMTIHNRKHHTRKADA